MTNQVRQIKTLGQKSTSWASNMQLIKPNGFCFYYDSVWMMSQLRLQYFLHCNNLSTWIIENIVIKFFFNPVSLNLGNLEYKSDYYLTVMHTIMYPLHLYHPFKALQYTPHLLEEFTKDQQETFCPNHPQYCVFFAFVIQTSSKATTNWANCEFFSCRLIE